MVQWYDDIYIYIYNAAFLQLKAALNVTYNESDLGTQAFVAGTRVRIDGLQSAPELNGREAKIVNFDEASVKWLVICCYMGQCMLFVESRHPQDMWLNCKKEQP